MPIIGVRRAIMQCRGMTMIVLRLLSLLGLKSRLRPPNKPFFGGGGRGVAGFVDSGPKTLVPSASNRSTPEWTRVDSSGLPPAPGRGDPVRGLRLAFASRPSLVGPELAETEIMSAPLFFMAPGGPTPVAPFSLAELRVALTKAGVT